MISNANSTKWRQWQIKPLTADWWNLIANCVISEFTDKRIALNFDRQIFDEIRYAQPKTIYWFYHYWLLYSKKRSLFSILNNLIMKSAEYISRNKTKIRRYKWLLSPCRRKDETNPYYSAYCVRFTQFFVFRWFFIHKFRCKKSFHMNAVEKDKSFFQMKRLEWTYFEYRPNSSLWWF